MANLTSSKLNLQNTVITDLLSKEYVKESKAIRSRQNEELTKYISLMVEKFEEINLLE